MKLDDLINLYVKVFPRYAISFTQTNSIGDREIPESICGFLAKLQREERLNPEEFEQFYKELTFLEKMVKDCIIRLVYNICLEIYEKHKEEIKQAVVFIEKHGPDANHLWQEAPNLEKYIGLINVYYLLANYLFKQKDINSIVTFPGVNLHQRTTLASEIPFAINAFTLTGKIPKVNYLGIDTHHALYPLNLTITQAEKLPLKRGVKVSAQFFPYKSVTKLAKGDTGDNTFLATNGTKTLFMRGVEDYAPHGIFASKIATLVSSTHFSSERLMDNKIVASKKSKTYACSVIDPAVYSSVESYIAKKKVFPGTGIIDEVSNYVCETDPNQENLGLSTTEIEKAHLSKIDFDRCFIRIISSKDNYEENIFSTFPPGIYRNLPHVQEDETYIKEKLYARLKLSMLTPLLLGNLANKAFMEKDCDDKFQSILACHARSDIALELFMEHPRAKQLLEDNQQLLKQCQNEIKQYIDRHFEQACQPALLCELLDRVTFINETLTQKFGLVFLTEECVSDTVKEKRSMTP